MKSVFILSSLILLFLVSGPLSAQVKIMAKEGEIMDLAELGAIVLQAGKKVEVKFIAPPESRPKIYRDVDIKTGDLFIMANGKSIKHVKDLNQIYQELKPGEKLKLAIQRDDKKFMVSFPRANPDDLPKRKRVMMRRGPGGVEKEIHSGEEQTATKKNEHSKK